MSLKLTGEERKNTTFSRWLTNDWHGFWNSQANWWFYYLKHTRKWNNEQKLGYRWYATADLLFSYLKYLFWTEIKKININCIKRKGKEKEPLKVWLDIDKHRKNVLSFDRHTEEAAIIKEKKQVGNPAFNGQPDVAAELLFIKRSLPTSPVYLETACLGLLYQTEGQLLSDYQSRRMLVGTWQRWTPSKSQ